MNQLIATLLGIVGTIAAVVIGQPTARAQEIVYERFENPSSGRLPGGVEMVDDVVGWGGLTEPNRHSAFFNGRASTGLDCGREKRVPSVDFTVEAFVKAARHADYAAIAADWNEEGDNRCWALVMTPRGALRFDVSPDGLFHVGNKLETAPRLIEPDKWYHVAAVSQGNASRIFVNGRQVAQTVRTAGGICAEPKSHLKIGNADRYASAGPRPWHGWLDEVRITLKSLTPDQFIKTRQVMPEARGPVPERFVMPFTATTHAEAVAWQTRGRKRLLELVDRRHPRRSLKEVPLEFQSGESEKKNGYTRYRASFQGNDGRSRYTCLLAVPDGTGPFPAMLALHGHGGSCDVVFDPSSIYGGLADRFARGGYVVLAPSFPHREYCATMLWDLMRAVDILESRDDVDPQRIGVAGLSMGGEWTMWSAACDVRLKVAVVSGWMCTTEGVFAVHNCPCWELPGLVELMDICEVHLLIAPRPVLFESAARDNCFPIRFTRQGFQRIQAGYRVFGAEGNVKQDIWPAGHEWHGKMAYPFVDNVLGGHAAGASR